MRTKNRQILYIFLSLLLFIVLPGHANDLVRVEQVSQLKVRHATGQTFLTWQEVTPPTKQEAIAVNDLIKIRQEHEKLTSTRYRIYRSKSPINSVKDMSPVATVPALTCWNTDYYGRSPQPQQQALRYVLEEGKGPVPPGTGIYVYNPQEAGEAYYAVTVIIKNEENTAIGPDNTLSTAIRETIGQGEPVLQRVIKSDRFTWVNNPKLYYYVRWESPPNASIQNRAFDYLIAIPPTLAKPAPVGLHLHGWGGTLNEGFGWWVNAEQGAILVSSNQIPYDWWTGYHELLWTGQPLKTQTDWRKGVVRAYSQRRMLSFLDWAATKWDIDLKRTFVSGNSMGGSGALMLALRFPDRIAWSTSWVGIHIPSKSPQFKESYAAVYGKPEWNVEFEDGTPVWDYFNDVWYLRQYPEKEVGFITFANGKNDRAIGWAQAVEFYQALQETKRPHLFTWGQGGHGERAIMPRSGAERAMPIDVRVDQTLPAFTRGSLDSNPGNGDPTDGDAIGQVNRYLYWETQDIVDAPTQWEMTVGLIDKAPAGETTVDITPRRCQKFKARPGEKFTWTNTALQGHKIIQTGQARANKWGLITLEQVIVSKGTNRIKIAP